MSHHQAILNELRKQGHRITPQREMIIDILAHSEKHMTAEEVLGELQQHTSAINITTVYRTLEMLWDEGYASRNDLREGKRVYSTAGHGPHLHLVCRHCHRVIEINPNLLNPLGEGIKKSYQFDVDLHHVSLFGVCADCQV